jgi:hypothetical protein
MFELCAESEPENVSVTGAVEFVDADDEGEVMSFRRLQPALVPATLAAIARAIPNRRRDTFDGTDGSDMDPDCGCIGAVSRADCR